MELVLHNLGESTQGFFSRHVPSQLGGGTGGTGVVPEGSVVGKKKDQVSRQKNRVSGTGTQGVPGTGPPGGYRGPSGKIGKSGPDKHKCHCRRDLICSH